MFKRRGGYPDQHTFVSLTIQLFSWLVLTQIANLIFINIWLIGVGCVRAVVSIVWNETSLPRLLNQLDIDVYHSVKQIGAIFSKTRKTVTIHDACYFLFPEGFGRADRSYWQMMQKLAAAQYDFILTVSKSSRDCLKSALSVPSDRIGVTYLGIDHAVYDKNPVSAQAEARVRTKYSLPESFIFWIGKMAKTKNVEKLVEAFSIIRRQNKTDCTLLLGGRPSDSYASIVRTVETQGMQIGRDVYFTGPVDAEDLPVMYKLARAFVFPSTHEGFGIPPLEAMACGTPVITSTAYSLPEVLGDAALYCHADDQKKMAELIDEVLYQPALRSDLIQKGYAQAARYTYEECARQTLTNYDRIAET